VINSLFARINNSSQVFTSVSELEGSWNCETISADKNSDANCIQDGLFWKKSGILTFNSTNKTWSYTKDGVEIDNNDPLSCMGYESSSSNGSYDIKNGLMAIRGYKANVSPIVALKKNSPESFSFHYFSNFGNTYCSKTNIAPLPPENLTIEVQNQTISLSWNHTDSGVTFKVQKKDSLKGDFSTITTTQNTSYQEEVSAGKYWYRVLATNTYGDSISSTEVMAKIP